MSPTHLKSKNRKVAGRFMVAKSPVEKDQLWPAVNLADINSVKSVQMTYQRLGCRLPAVHPLLPTAPATQTPLFFPLCLLPCFSFNRLCCTGQEKERDEKVKLVRDVVEASRKNLKLLLLGTNVLS